MKRQQPLLLMFERYSYKAVIDRELGGYSVDEQLNLPGLIYVGAFNLRKF
jgi:hypothetical protein